MPSSRLPLPIALVNVLGGLIYGYTGLGVTSGLDLMYHCILDLHTETQTWQAAILLGSINVGAMMGALGSAYIIHRVGPTRSILIAALCSGSILLSLLPMPYTPLLLLRVITGFGIGFATSACPTYVADTAPSHWKATLAGSFCVFLTLGVVLGNLATFLALGPDRDAPVTDFCQTHASSISHIHTLLLIPAGVVSGSLFSLLLVTPSKGDPSAESLVPSLSSELRPSPSYFNLQPQWVCVSTYASSFTSFSPLEDLLALPAWYTAKKALALGLVMAMATQLTGISAVMFYAPTFFEAAGMVQKRLASVLLMTCNFLACVLALVIVDRFPRRAVLLPCMFLLSSSVLLLWVVNAYLVDHGRRTVLSFVLLGVYVFAFEVGPGCLFWVICSEIFPPFASLAGFIVTNSLQWAFNILVSIVFPPLERLMGPQVFLCFAVPGLLLALYLCACLPETKDHSPAAISHAIMRGPWLNWGRLAGDHVLY
eukprot:NODE_1281_length_1567_cov_33.704861_g1210_i0.p1 GENE.NODE_1281_length_1567_cov_33.704861_g1210_i0~~NODE_1281_length_1567_cov_33.704861_g1210_i0.p1  ORF type:complete len:500 (+),score=119.41 NODE_1281_length_1567_cov_33.704861_g1210_i0:53-1501(+)